MQTDKFIPPEEKCSLTFRQEFAALSSTNDKNASVYEKWGAWYDRCQSRLPINVSTRWQLANASKEYWNDYLEKVKIKKNETANLKNIISARLQHYEKVTSLRKIIEKVLNFKPTKDKAKDALILQDYVVNLRNLPQGLLKNFGFLLLAKESSNSSKIKSILEEIIHWEPRVLPFYGIDTPLGEETWNSVDLLLTDIVKNLKDKILAKAFLTRVFQFIDVSKLPKLKEVMDLDWSLNDLREHAKSPWYASLFPAFWYSQLSGRIASSEMNDINLKLINKKKINDWNVHDLWMFSDWMPNDELIRKDIIDAIVRINSLDEDYMKELVIRLSENSIIRKHLDEIGVLPTKALFKLRRDFYHKLLNQGKHIDYSLYHLIVLGDEQQKYLWWYALDPFKNSI